MTEKLSRAAEERAAAQRALANGELKKRDTYTAKQIAMRCGTDAKTMRKFFRSSHSTVEPVGQGGRYEFAATDLPLIRKEFDTWLRRSSVTKRQASTPKQLVPRPKPKAPGVHGEGLGTGLPNDGDYSDTELRALKILTQWAVEPTDEELTELEVIGDLDLDDLEDDS